MSKADEVKEFYSNDIVYRINKHKRVVFGVVVDTYEVSSDVDDYHALQKGQIKILWNNNSREQVWRQNRVRLTNRSIIPGDVVRRLEKGKETQRGYCRENKQISTVQIVGTDRIIENVLSDRLQSVRPLNVDDAVCLGDKFGRIESVEQMVQMQSKCGSIVEILTSINHDLDDYWLSKRNTLSFDAFYPGQEIICVPSNLEQPHWIKKTKTMKKNMQTRQRFTVQNVEDILIEVSWYNAGSGYSNVTEMSQDDIKKLKVVEHPNDTSLELAERRLLKLSRSDTVVRKRDWIRKLSSLYRPHTPKVRHIISSHCKITPKMSKVSSFSFVLPLDNADEDEWSTEDSDVPEDSDAVATKKHYPPKLGQLLPGNTLPIEIICVESKVTVVWQDGTVERDISSTQLYYSFSLDEHEFFPGEWVVLENEKENCNYGVIQNVDCLGRTACIKWFTFLENEKEPVQLMVNEASVYDLKKYTKFAFRPDSIVKSKPKQDEKMGKVVDSYTEGYIKVLWLDGKEEDCWPNEIELIPEASECGFSAGESSSDDAAGNSWETESIESYADDLTDETVLQNMAARLDFIRNRIVYLKEAFKEYEISENFSIIKDLLQMYEVFSYLDKSLGTSFFSTKSRHFQALLTQAKEKAKSLGIDLKGRIFSSDNICSSVAKIKVAEKENINKIIKLENKVNTQIENQKAAEATIPQLPNDETKPSLDNISVELLSMLKIRVDLAYAEIISRIGGSQAFSVLTKASENIVNLSSSLPPPSCPTTPEILSSNPLASQYNDEHDSESENYKLLDEAPVTHYYFPTKFEPTDLQRFLKAVQREYKLLKESLPPGVWVRTYSNRIDLLSVMICGPAKTPYEDGLFLFDIQLSVDYPRSPPLVHYISYSSERLNPNLYVEGKVCVSLLGTWMGRGTEVWGPNSTLLQLIVSIQGLILVAEPYYNEAGYEKQTDTQQGYENSRTYNEVVVLKLVQSMKEMLHSPHEVFKEEIITHFKTNGLKLCERLNSFCKEADPVVPDFPLLPVSKGLRLSLASALKFFQDSLFNISDKSGDT